MTDLRSCLGHFQEKFNSNGRVKKLIKGWDRFIFVDSTDTGAQYTMVVSDLNLIEILDGQSDQEYVVHVQAAEDILKRIFSGDYNPAHALIDGALAVFSNERDKVKLEAIAMVIWGL